MAKFELFTFKNLGVDVDCAMGTRSARGETAGRMRTLFSKHYRECVQKSPLHTFSSALLRL